MTTYRFFKFITVILLINCLPFFVNSSFADESWFHLGPEPIPTIDCPARDDSCFLKVENFLAPFQISYWDGIQLNQQYKYPPADGRQKDIGNQVWSIGRKAAVTVIAIHGLYGNSSQFEEEAYVFQKMGYNIISLTLPGHGFDMNNHKSVHFEDWMDSVKKAADLGLQMGEKLIFYGQSTGGLLSLWGASTYSQDTILQVLIEPAFVVKPHLAISTCLLKSIISEAQKLDFISKRFIGISTKKIRQPISLNMGCQVHKMGQKLIPQIKRIYDEKTIVDNNVRLFKGFAVDQGSLFHTNTVPAMIGWTSNDEVVDHNMMEVAAAIMGATTVSGEDLGDGKNSGHGYAVQNAIRGDRDSYTFEMYKAELANKNFIGIFSLLEKDPEMCSYIRSHFNYSAVRRADLGLHALRNGLFSLLTEHEDKRNFKTFKIRGNIFLEDDAWENIIKSCPYLDLKKRDCTFLAKFREFQLRIPLPSRVLRNNLNAIVSKVNNSDGKAPSSPLLNEKERSYMAESIGELSATMTVRTARKIMSSQFSALFHLEGFEDWLKNVIDRNKTSTSHDTNPLPKLPPLSDIKSELLDI